MGLYFLDTQYLYCTESNYSILGASEVSANLYCNSRTSVLGRFVIICSYLWVTQYVCLFIYHPLQNHYIAIGITYS